MKMLFAVVVAFGSAVLSTLLVKRFAQRAHVVDRAERAQFRKLHRHAVPLLGGVALYASFVFTTAVFWGPLTGGYLLPKHLIGMWLAGFVLMVGGALDDWKQLRPARQFFFPLLATIIIIASGIGINFITNPFDGTIGLQQWEWTVLWRNGLPYKLTLLADLFTLAWLLMTSYTTKLLDGLDGLVPGIGTIGAIIIALVSFRSDVNQPETGIIALILAAACVGFLLWNFSPAKIYLGEGGSLFIGFMLGLLAIISGGKIATALLILGLPMLDVLWVVIRRMLFERRSPFRGDTLHLHFQLKQLRWSERKIVLFYYGIVGLFGVSTIWLQGKMKVVALIVLSLITFRLVVWLYHQAKKGGAE